MASTGSISVKTYNSLDGCAFIVSGVRPARQTDKAIFVISVRRIHDFSAGHRVVGHEHRCRFLHGHNYRVTFECTALELDDLGRVIDFSMLKQLLCQWLEDNWDHRTLLWEKDDLIGVLGAIADSVVQVPFNPTAENMASYLLKVVGPQQLAGTGVTLSRVTVEETRKCSAEAAL